MGSTVWFYFEAGSCYAMLLAYQEPRLQAGPDSVYSFVFQKLSGHCPLELALDLISSSLIWWETLGTGKVVVFDMFIIECKTSQLLLF